MIRKIFMSLMLILVIAMPSSADAATKTFVPNVPIMPLKQLKPGMMGMAYTVIQGKEITSFKVTVIGVIPRKTSPKNLILFRIEDKKVVDNGGVAAGMSGSPIYVNGKLIGAIGYSWSFSERSLGLATPIEEMTKAFSWPEKLPSIAPSAPIPSEPVSPDKPVSQDVKSEDAKIEVSADAAESDKESSTDVKVSEDAKVSEEKIVTISEESLKRKPLKLDELMDRKFTPLAMPLLVDGVSPRVTSMLEKKLGQTLIPLGASGNSSANSNLKKTLKPGAAMGVALAWGDFQMGGIGTLSAVDKQGNFLAFAHPMMNYGAVAYPLTDAEIVKIIPSSEHSFKLGYMGDIIGIVTQDRPEAIAGHMGKLAAASSYTVRFNDVDTKRSSVKRFQTVADPFIGPSLGSLGILGIIDDQWGRSGEGTAMIKYRFSGGNLRNGWERSNIFFSDKDIISSLVKEFDDLAKIFSLNQFQEIRPFGVDVSVEMTRDPRVVFIEKMVIVDKKEFYKPGEKVTVELTLRPWRKRPKVQRVTLNVPKKAAGFCEITVRGGGIEEPDSESLAAGLRSITNLKDLLKEMSVKESNNQIIVSLDGPQDKLKGKDPRAMAAMSPEDFLDDRLMSEILKERFDEGSMRIIDTNYYVEGVLRKFIKVKNSEAEQEAEIGIDEGEETETAPKHGREETKPKTRGEEDPELPELMLNIRR